MNITNQKSFNDDKKYLLAVKGDGGWSQTNDLTLLPGYVMQKERRTRKKPTCTTRSDSWADAHRGNWLGAKTVIVAPEVFLSFSIFSPDTPIRPPAWDPAIKSLIVLAAKWAGPIFSASLQLLSSCFGKMIIK